MVVYESGGEWAILSPSGKQYEIGLGDQVAAITEVGGTLRTYRCGDRDVIDGFDESEICPSAHGAVLFPWPNRIKDGTYSYKGKAFQLDLSEPSTSSAIHGLIRWRPFDLLVQGDNYVTLQAELSPTPGYPFGLALQITYQLGSEGLEVLSKVTNTGGDVAPLGIGYHPYISLGPNAMVDDAVVSMLAKSCLCSDPKTGVVKGAVSCLDANLDFSLGKHLKGVELDQTFLDLARDPDGVGWVYVSGKDDRVVALWFDAYFSHVQLFTSDTLPGERRRKAIAVEPMTCGPQAFRSGANLLELAPSEQISMSWGVKLL